MFNIIEDRGTGKTRRLMEEAYKNNGIFVCQNAYPMREKANAYGFVGLQIVSFEEFIENIRPYLMYGDVMKQGFEGPNREPIYIDELEGFVNFICFNKFKGYTITKDIIK